MKLAVSLALRDPEGAAALAKRLYDPADPIYHQFLKKGEFTARFGPLVSDANQVAQYFKSVGLNVTRIHGSNALIDVEGSVSDIENALQVEVSEYLTWDGRVAHAVTSEPSVGSEIASKLIGITGLNNFAHAKSHVRRTAQALAAVSPHYTTSSAITPSMIKSAYNLSGLAQTGAGETIALFELDTYSNADIAGYVSTYGLPTPSPSPSVISEGAIDGSSTDGRLEVTLDIELALALAPGAKILVYEGSNPSGILGMYDDIATDDLANEISTSWGLPEDEIDLATASTEEGYFLQYSTNGQSFFAAAGDNGAYDDTNNSSELVVDDPGTQKYATSVGGTTLSFSAGNTYGVESSWGDTSVSPAAGGGGGISSFWTTPTWQSEGNVGTTTNKGSSTHRMVPDVSLNANPDTGYAIYFEGGVTDGVGGTSCAAPLWAAFTALVNQGRGSGDRIGFINPSIYQIGQSSIYSSVFHDVNDNSTNLYYPAVTGYDLATGWGSFNGANLYAALVSATLPPYPPATVTTTPEVLAMGLSWAAASGATSYTLMRSTSASGTYTSIYSGAATTFTDTPLSYGTYYYYVTATNAAGTSGISTIASGTTLINPPAAPATLTATLVTQ
jgi:kumamolisin